jgi:D-tyrosyl-tRNA(Tyr) deacylase
MKFGIVVSKQDEAGMNIARHLDGLEIDYVVVDEQTIYEDNLEKRDELRDVDFVIFATKHEAEKETKTFSVHAPGNFGKAELGGKEGEICLTSCLFMKHVFKILNGEKEKAGLDYEISMEATHHGPIIEKQCLFIEIGSTEKQWNDSRAGELIAKVIQKAISEKPKDAESVLCIGGPHYCPNFNKIQLNSNYAVGHVIAQYNFPVTREMIEEGLKKTSEDIKKVVIDWKGCGKSEERQKLIDLLDEFGLEVLRSDKIDK